MLDIMTDNWDELGPNVREGDRLLQIKTGNDMDNLFVIVDHHVEGGEIEDEIRLALRSRYGSGCRYEGYEDVTELYPRPERFEMYELEAYAGEYADDFDLEAIMDEVTFVYHDGNRYWRALEEGELDEVFRRHDKV